MGSSSTSRLPYRALTASSPAALGERVQEAIEEDGYELVGGLTCIQPDGPMTTFCQLVIDPDRVSRDSGVVTPKCYKIVEGDTTRSFCEQVSELISLGWLIRGKPMLYLEADTVRMYQVLVRLV